jgi:hypothetical protein
MLIDPTTIDTRDTNRFRSARLINRIETTRTLDLRTKAQEIAQAIDTANLATKEGRETILTHFHQIIELDHAKLHGLGTDYHDAREWGFNAHDDKFLSSLRFQHLGNIYGTRPTPPPLSLKQIACIRRNLRREFYTMQLALIA